MNSTDKFSTQDRALVIKEIEKIQKAKLEQVKPSRKFFTDGSGKFYCIFGGREDWHGISASLMQHLHTYSKETLLVVAKKYKTRIDICVGTVDVLVEQKEKLPRTKQDGFQFHTILTEDGMFFEEIPELRLRKISEVMLSSVTEISYDLSEIKKIINLELLPSFSNIEPDEELTHSDIEAKILLVGKWLGHRTFTPDSGKISRYGKLGNLCTDKRMPTEYVAQRLIDKVKQIDVIWFDDEGCPTHCFEVEHTTDITKGLLRMYQIRKLRIKMFIVANDTSKIKFDSEVDKDPFFHIKEEFVFRSYKELHEFFESVKKFALVKGSFLNEDD